MPESLIMHICLHLPKYSFRLYRSLASVFQALFIVDGGQTLRVCPYHPNQVLQTSETELALRDTQTQFYVMYRKPKPT